jgi:hypothetical protein
MRKPSSPEQNMSLAPQAQLQGTKSMHVPKKATKWFKNKGRKEKSREKK